MSNEAILIRRSPSTGISLPVATLRDTRLSFRARGVLALLLTYDNETLISTADLSSHGTEGRDALRTALAELREFSYVQQTRYSYQDDRGRSLWAWETVVSDAPLPSPENPSSAAPISPGNPSSEMGLVTTPSTRREKHCDTPDISTTTEDGFSVFPSYITTNSSSPLDVSHLKSPLPSAPPACSTSEGWHLDPEGKPKPGWEGIPDSSNQTNREKRRSKGAQQAADAKAEQESTDPFVALGEDDARRDGDASWPNAHHGEPRAPRQVRVDQARRNKVLAKRLAAEKYKTPAVRLGLYFEEEATEPDPAEPAGRFNAAALAASARRWMDDGSTYEHLCDMVDEYWNGSFRRNLAAPAWKDFLASQDKIHAQLERRFKAEEVEANRANPEYWT